MKNLISRGRVALGLVVAGGCLIQAANVAAAPMNVIAIVDQFCELGTLTDVDFGTLIPGGGDAPGNGAIEWRCSNGTSADIAIDDGGLGTRDMVGGAVTGTATLSYQLYKDVGLTSVWGDSGTAVVNVSGAGLAAFSTEIVYGEVLAVDYVNAEQGSYSDIVDVTITIL